MPDRASSIISRALAGISVDSAANIVYEFARRLRKGRHIEALDPSPQITLVELSEEETKLLGRLTAEVEEQYQLTLDKLNDQQVFEITRILTDALIGRTESEKTYDEHIIRERLEELTRVLPAAARNEQIVRYYFRNRTGWTATKLDLGRQPAPDFRICDNGNCFLCEVKTIQSVRAGAPSAPAADRLLEEREKGRTAIEEQMRRDPSRKILMPSQQWEFLYSDEMDFRKKYRHLGRNTQYAFLKLLDEPMRAYFAESGVSSLPYVVRLDSDDLYVPTESERGCFFEWLEKEIQAIDRGESASWLWVVQPQPHGQPVYTAFYPFHKPEHVNDPASKVQLTVRKRLGPGEKKGLKLDIHYYGTLNLDAVTRNVERGVEQLRQAAAREIDPRIARIIVLAFEKSFGGPDDWDLLSEHVDSLLRERTSLSAIAVLTWVADGIPPAKEDGVFAWLAFQTSAPKVPAFHVYHNPWLDHVNPLDWQAFADERSTQEPRGRQQAD